MIFRVLCLISVLGLVACSNSAKQNRSPNQVSGHDHPAPEPTAEFLREEKVPRQHSFIFPDPKGHFGYHVTQFHANHQHQFIVQGKLVPVNGKGSTKRKLEALEKSLAKKTEDGLFKNGYFSVTSDLDRFLLSELISGQRKDFLANVYDGLIITRPQAVLEESAKYLIEKKLFEHTMHANDGRLENSVYIVFGTYGKPQKKYYLAHLIKAANNFEQILVAEFDQPKFIPNGTLMALDLSDKVPLKAGEEHLGQIEGESLKFKVKKEVYFDRRTAEGFAD